MLIYHFPSWSLIVTIVVTLAFGPEASRAEAAEPALPRIIQVQPIPPDEPARFGNFIEFKFEGLPPFYENPSFDVGDFALSLNKSDDARSIRQTRP